MFDNRLLTSFFCATQRSGFGFGDYLVWTGSPVSPHESMLYEYDVNFPDMEEYPRRTFVDEVSKYYATSEVSHFLST